MTPKLCSLCMLAVVSGLSSLVSIDANIFDNLRGSGATKGKPTEDVSDILLEEVVTESGDVVGFYELEPGVVLLKTTSTANHLYGNNPHTRAFARNKMIGKISKSDVAALYKQLTGTKPRGRVAEALSRVDDDGNGDSTGGRDLRTEPTEDEDFDENGSHHPQDRELEKTKVGKISDKDFKKIFCLNTAECRTKMKDNYSVFTQGFSYGLAQAVYTDKGNIRHTIYYRSCSSCDWVKGISSWIAEGYAVESYVVSNYPKLYGGYVDYVNGGDTFHIATLVV